MERYAIGRDSSTIIRLVLSCDQWSGIVKHRAEDKRNEAQTGDIDSVGFCGVRLRSNSQYDLMLQRAA